MVCAPVDSLAGADRVGGEVGVLDGRGRDLQPARQEQRVVLAGQRERLLLGQPERPRLRVVLRVATGGLRRQPLGEVALVAAGALSQLRRRHRLAVAHRDVQPEPVADQHGRGV
jgi:hypothetical protein